MVLHAIFAFIMFVGIGIHIYAALWTRGSMRAIADGVEQPVPSTIEDPAVLDALRPTLTS